jgi:integrase
MVGLCAYHCFNYNAGILTVHDSKGKKDRTVPIPQTLAPALKQQLQKVATVYEADMRAKFAGTFLPDQLERKYKNAAKKFIWQWFFPAHSLTFLREPQEYKRYHIHERWCKKRSNKRSTMPRLPNALRRIPFGIIRSTE